MNNDIIDIIESILAFFIICMTWYLFALSSYTVFLSLWGFTKNKKDYPDCSPEARFLLLIAAHNEEEVIGSTILNLKEIQYDRNLFNIIVVNDNSTDRTGIICDSYGIKHIDTAEGEFEREGVGKPAGIQYALRKLGFEAVKQNYDLIMILDADNFVDTNILAELNSQWLSKGKPEAIQAYLDCKNSVSLLSFGYCTSYWMMNRFFQLSKYRLGLPNAIGGTGFVVCSKFLINTGGFCFKSLTEDIELEIEIVRKHGRVLWNHNTRIYDEKPDNLRVSLKQRFRWSKGHWYVAFTNLLNLLKLTATERKWKYVDQLLYLFSMGRALQVLIIVINILLLNILQTQESTVMKVLTTTANNLTSPDIKFTDSLLNILSTTDWSVFVINLNIVTLISICYGMLILPIYGAWMDKRVFLNPFKVFFSGLYFGLSFVFVQFLAIFFWKKQHKWVATPHNKTKEEHK
ncbi:glycosyltransferase family 2 protein [Salmonella enterica]|uniref:Glycosyltransferase family 2 protein n=1 Tax=Salmonella enterica TaxID=28901 RepID=A0A5V3WA29_SALER|nr:glycosyltransferase family 2 protein [Salmonella enterica]EDD5833171.1 glycosyltransferase [Salmonella enterica subsp. enterica serovar Enteritidis]EBU0743651.1 glycosyltransferase family 2 protein [Salmonella enterica]EGF3844647.1 glycosyltransferase family 2 protein [Salmonella enterica]EHK5508671.1 glycosyltransferase family 2 protein [Salmonella enterica]